MGAENLLKKNAEIATQIEAIIEEETAGDPCGPVKWIRQNNLRGLQAKLGSLGVFLSHVSIRRILKQEKYSLKANQKSVSLTQHPKRNQQFCYIRRVKKLFITGSNLVCVSFPDSTNP